MKTLESVKEDFPEVNFLYGERVKDYILGVDDESKRLICSVTACVEWLVRDGMKYQDATERFEFNINTLGVDGPIWCYDG